MSPIQNDDHTNQTIRDLGRRIGSLDDQVRNLIEISDKKEEFRRKVSAIADSTLSIDEFLGHTLPILGNVIPYDRGSVVMLYKDPLDGKDHRPRFGRPS